MNINEMIVKNYNEIFKNHNKKIEDFSTWYHNFYGSYGAQEIEEIDGSFHISIICHSEFKKIIIPFKEMIERIYFYDKCFLEYDFMFSYNSGKMTEDMKDSPSCDGYYMLLNDTNRSELSIQINKELLSEYRYSLAFYHRGIKRNKTLPEIPETTIENMFDEINYNNYKHDYIKPHKMEEISLENMFILETFT